MCCSDRLALWQFRAVYVCLSLWIIAIQSGFADEKSAITDGPADALRPANRRWEVTIHSSGTLSLVSICSDYETPQERWWQPDGKIIDQSVRPKVWVKSDKGNALCLAFIVTPANTPLDDLEIDTYPRSSASTIYGIREEQRMPVDGEDAIHLFLSIVLDPDVRRFDLTVTGSTVDWAPLCNLNHQTKWEKLEAAGILLLGSRRQQEHIYSVIHSNSEVKYRFRNLDTNGADAISRKVSWTHHGRTQLEMHALPNVLQQKKDDEEDTDEIFDDNESGKFKIPFPLFGDRREPNHSLEWKPRKVVKIQQIPAHRPGE